MKLISITILVISFAVNGISNEQFVFPPKFQAPGMFASDSSLYLPPESQTPIPYFPIKKTSSLPFPYLPPSGNKTPIGYPSPFPMILSSTVMPNDKDEDDKENKISISKKNPQFQYNRSNRTDIEEPAMIKRDTRPETNQNKIQRMFNYHHPIDRIDVRFPSQMPNGFSTPNPNIQRATPRAMIISAETHRNDNIYEQVKAGSSQSSHFIAPPNVFISSTTEPAIPILRLSNEMDLDGSFSYEALGADQTHYVQHSHMENLGTDKEEQVVEGSYSYVGDNGQTYTVHYIADSNGFRASGDHLPVPPPIPEIIQRSIQYNLAEEAKKPPHLKSWQAEEQEREANEINDKTQRFAITPLRNLFTGRTPEAFSYDFSQRSNNQNNLATAASSQNPVKATIDFTNDQSKIKTSGPISPQVTFLATQGAHVPSINTAAQSLSRMFTTEKSIMPQLVNYEADDNNKALWRWQYGINSNNINQTPEKTSISRSFGEGDDIMINFSEMTPEQYTRMLQSQGMSNARENVNSLPIAENVKHKTNLNHGYNNIHQYTNINKSQKHSDDDDDDDEKKNFNYKQSISTTEIPTTQNYPSQSAEEWYRNSYDIYKNANLYMTSPTEISDIKTQENHDQTLQTLNQQSDNNQVASKTHSYEDNTYEPKRIKSLYSDTAMKSYINDNNINYDKNISSTYTKINSKSDESENKSKAPVTHESPATTISSLKLTDFISREFNNEFQPMIKTYNEGKQESSATDTENIDESILNNNIFLKNIINSKKITQQAQHKITEDAEKNIQMKPKNAETKSDKIAKFITMQSKPYNDIKLPKKKPLDVSDILNYITMKNHFESSKIKTKNSPANFGSYKQANEMHYIPLQNEHDSENEEYKQKESSNNYNLRALHPQNELRGNIKNYKILHRHNNVLNSGYDSNEIIRELVPPPVKFPQSQNLPPLGRAGPSTKSYLPPLYV